jgi:hypothetical protein
VIVTDEAFDELLDRVHLLEEAGCGRSCVVVSSPSPSIAPSGTS